MDGIDGLRTDLVVFWGDDIYGREDHGGGVLLLLRMEYQLLLLLLRL